MSRKLLCFLSVIVALSTITPLVRAEDQTVFGPSDFEIGSWHVHFSRHTFHVDDPGTGYIVITKNTPDMEIRGGFLFFNRRFIPLRQFLVGDDIIVYKDRALKSTNRLTVFLRGTPGASVTIEVRRSDSPVPPPEVTFSADPMSITLGDSSTLTWQTTYADIVIIDHDIGEVSASGSEVVTPQETTTYILAAIGPGGSTTESVTVTVTTLPPTVEIEADPETIHVGESATLSWSSTNAESCVIEPDVGVVDLEGWITVTPIETTTYTIAATGPGGTATDSVTVTVTEPAPTVEISADPDSIHIGEPATLSWTSTHANTCMIEPDIGSVDPTGSITVSPSETTTYTITATGPGGTATASVTVTIVNSAPVADAQPVSTDEDSAVSITLTGSDADGDTLTYSVDSGPSHGTLAGTAPNLTYDPDLNYNGPDSFTFTVNDGTVDSEPATVGITVAAVNDRPAAADDAATTNEDTPVTTANVLANDTDVDGDTLTVSTFTQPAHGTVTSLGDGAFTYTPNPNFNGTDSFTYTASDGEGGTDTATVSITVDPVNDAPAANDQPVTLNEDESADITLTGTDIDGDSLTYEIVAGPGHGTLAGTAPDLTYTPSENYNGSDLFTFKVNDGIADSNTAAVTLTINAVNDAPVADAGPDQTAIAGDTVSLDGSGSNDVDGDTLTYEWSFVSTPPGSGAMLLDASAVNPTLVVDVSGTYEVQLIVNDGTAGSAPDTVTITASPRMVEVPEVLGLAQAEAEAAIIAADLAVGTITTENSDTVPEGHVISQDPAAGISVEEGSPVDLVVSLGPASTTPTVSISATPETIQVGESSTLSWTSTNAQNAYIDNGIGVVSVNGSTTVSPDHTTTYAITVTGPNGSASAQGMVKVMGNPEPQPEGSFGEQYEDLIPPDATVESYDPKRFSVITGLVQDLAGSPIADVSVTIHDHPEYGTVATDADGRFSIPVEGGGTITVVYQKDGLLTAHRKVYVPWNDIAIAKSIVMIAEDPAATTLSFDGDPETVVTHQSTEVADDFGNRSCTMVFTGDNRAYLVDEDGNDVHELSTITTRATEFTTPESMPAVLPPTSAYTYCVELRVDGAERVRFDKPVITWVENFLGFDVGEIVPVGYYDRDRGFWVPSDNGMVVRLLDTDMDGIVDALDADGDDQPDDLNDNGSFRDEVIGLDDAAKYPPGSTFWRVAVPHFSSWDCNWPYGPPSDAVPPNPEGEPKTDQQVEKDCKMSCSSFVEERSRIFHEDVPIPGTDMTLHYASNRVRGYYHKITVPASGETVPESLTSITVKLEVAGRCFKQILDSLPNQKAEFIWDGLDYLGRPVNGPTSAHVRVGFVYEMVYLSSGNFAKAFAQAGGAATTIVARRAWTSWMRSSLFMNAAQGDIAEGWTLSIRHVVSLTDLSTLVKGDGNITRNNASVITRASDERFISPDDVAVDASGSLYIVETQMHRIRKIDTNGSVSTVAGRPTGYGVGGYSGDGGPATEALLNQPTGVAVDASGNLYIADKNNQRIRRVDINGIITTVAGSGPIPTQWPYDGGYSGDGGPATEALLNQPTGVAVDASGNLYIADANNNRIRRVDINGIITTVAGSGPTGWQNGGYSGDGGSAIGARLSYPTGVAVDVAGNLYIADTNNNRIRKVDASGIITTVAGNGTAGSNGDGGPATEAQLNWPRGVAVDVPGNLYIADCRNHRIRKVGASGIITTVAGNGTAGSNGDGGPATQAQLNWPVGVATDASGSFYVSDGNVYILKVASLSAFSDVMTTQDIAFAEENGLGHIMSNAGRHKRTIDLDTGVTLYEFGYDEENELVSITDRFGNQITIDRDASGVPTAITSPDGITTTLTIDANNHLTRITYPDGGYYSFEYTPDGLMTAKIEPEGNRFEHVFDSMGRLTDAADQEGGHWQYTRTAYANGDILTEALTGEGNLTSYLDRTDSTGAYTSSITDPTGAETLFTQSADGLSVSKSLACGIDLTFKYDLDSEYKFKYVREMTESTPSALERVTLREKTYADTNSDDVPDRIIEEVTVNGKATTLVHDTLQSSKVLASPEGRTVTSLYDPVTLLTTSLAIPGLYDTTFDYDTRGRLTSTSASARETTFAYDVQGFLESVTDPEGHTTIYDYDAVGRMTGISRPDGTSLGFTYDNNGNMTVLANPSTINHGFGFNGVNLNSSYQTPISGSYSYVYDKDRRLIQTSFPSGNQINNVYDKTRLTQIQTPEGNIDLTYLCGTKLGSISKGTESITYGYDGKLVTSETLSGTLSQSLSYGYNNEFNMNSFTYASDTHIYTYDDDGLLTGAGGFTIFRNAANGLPEAVTGGALNLSRTFNGYGEVEAQDFAVSGSSLTSWSLTRDDNGRITDKAETIDGATSNYVYTYDPMGRLLTVTKDSTLVEEYQYGINGTRTYEINALRGISGRTFDYSYEDHLLTAGDATYQYNVDGFLTTKIQGTDVTTFDYSSRGELLGVTLPDGPAIDYVHDPLGRRIAKIVSGVTTEKYLWQGLTRLLAVYDGSDNLVMRFEYADGRMPVAMTKGGITYCLTYDQVRSLRLVADAAGNVVKRVDYDSFGNIITDTDPSFAIPFGFAGGLHDRDTGLVRFGFRDYDPDTGRWTAKDPILFAGGDTDFYGYCLGDPINWVDPFGLKGGGILIPIREFIKRNVKGGDIIAPIIEKGLNIPTSPFAILLYDYLNPAQLNVGEDFLIYQHSNSLPPSIDDTLSIPIEEIKADPCK